MYVISIGNLHIPCAFYVAETDKIAYNKRNRKVVGI